MTALDDAIAAARNGRLVAIPTDTVYGIGTRADDPAATARIFEAKGRSPDVDLPVFVASVGDARRLSKFDARAEALAASFWPGALTIVLPRADESAAWHLGGDGATIGLRIPGHSLARAVVEGVGALAISSANKSGEPTATTCDELVAAFGELVDVYLCGEKPGASSASTVVTVAETGVRVLRPGPIGEDAVLRALSSTQ